MRTRSSDFSDVLLRWSIGRQDTTSLSNFRDDAKFADFVWLAKLSIVSFQRRFPGARVVLLFNGNDFDEFVGWFHEIKPRLLFPIDAVDQVEMMQEMSNPYKFAPRGVWWKWLPFRLDINKHEIAIDTDIICINDPMTWYEWLDGDEELFIAPERYEKVLVNTCGDFYQHPILKGKKPFNCGVVGQRAGVNYADRFFEIASEVDFGKTHNSLFITEQGAINLWVRSLEMEGVSHKVLDFQKNAWMRDFIYFMQRGVQVETVHAVTWYKKVVRGLQESFERKILDDSYDNTALLADIFRQASQPGFGRLGRWILDRQVGSDDQMEVEYFFQ